MKSPLLRALGATFLLFCLSFLARAEAPQADPHQLVREVSSKIETLLADYRAGKVSSSAQLNQGLSAVLEPVVSFKRIAAGVMGAHRENASKAQKAAFLQKFKTELISTYAKGMLGLGDFTIKVLDPKAPVGEKRLVSVLMNAVTDKGDTRIAYTMRKGRKSGQWKLVNVVLNGVNMGKTFAGQFDEAMRQNGNDLDKVIANWGEGNEVAEAVAESAKKGEK
ncbi:MAG: ABC transporter substrate-binding protein [Cellvibrionaceae bacterium]|nr:ABC transporter substrate-binding protein [Cellvibrionaceae bacterium]